MITLITAKTKKKSMSGISEFIGSVLDWFYACYQASDHLPTVKAFQKEQNNT